MTTIAWDGKHLASDTRCTASGGLKRQVLKIFPLPDGSLYGACGSAEQNGVVRAWLAGEIHKPSTPLEDFTGMVIRPDATIWMYEKLLTPWQVFDKKHAIGSGRDYALMAMHFGKTAYEAVELASQFDAWTALPITVLKLLKEHS